MQYSDVIIQDDLYLISSIGWMEWAKIHEIFPSKDKNGKAVWWEEHDYLIGKNRYKSDLIPKQLIIDRYHSEERDALEVLYGMQDSVDMDIEKMIEEYSGESETGYFESFDKVNKGTVTARIKEIKWQSSYADELIVLQEYLGLLEKQSEVKGEIKNIEWILEKKIIESYKTLTESEIKSLVVDDKWMTTLENTIKSEMDRISQRLAGRIWELSERYDTPLPTLVEETESLMRKVDEHLRVMGFNF